MFRVWLFVLLTLLYVPTAHGDESFSVEMPDGWTATARPNVANRAKYLMAATDPSVPGSSMFVAALDSATYGEVDDDRKLDDYIRGFAKTARDPKILERGFVKVAGVPAARFRAESTVGDRRMGQLVFVGSAPGRQVAIAFNYPAEELSAAIPQLEATVQRTRGLVAPQRRLSDYQLGQIVGQIGVLVGGLAVVLVLTVRYKRQQRAAQRTAKIDGPDRPPVEWWERQ